MQHKKVLSPPQSLENNNLMYGTFTPSAEFNTDIKIMLNQLLENYLQKEHDIKINSLDELRQLSPPLLMYFFAEIKLMIQEKGPFIFNDREPGCFTAFFKAFAIALKNIERHKLSKYDITLFHQLCTDPDLVNMTTIGNFSGSYRPESIREFLKLPISSMSVDGLATIIDLIRDNHLGDLTLQFFNGSILNKFYTSIRYLELLQALLNQKEINFNDTQQVGLLDKINDLLLQKGFLNKQLELTTINELAFVLEQICHQYNQNLVLKSGDPVARFVEYLKILANGNKKNIEQIFATNIDRIRWEIDKTIRVSSKVIIDKDYLNNNIPSTKLAQQIMNDLKNDSDIQFQFVFDCKNVENLMALCLDSFNNKLESFKNKSIDEILTFLCSHIQIFLLIHPFVDANNRVFANIITNCMLHEFGLPFAIYYNPLIFYGHSVPEIVEGVKLACANYLALKNYANTNENHGLIFYDTALSKNQLDKLESFASPILIQAAKHHFLVEENKPIIDEHPNMSSLVECKKIIAIQINMFKSMLSDKSMTMFTLQKLDPKILDDELDELNKLDKLELIISKLESLAASHQDNHMLFGMYKTLISHIAHAPSQQSDKNKLFD